MRNLKPCLFHGTLEEARGAVATREVDSVCHVSVFGIRVSGLALNPPRLSWESSMVKIATVVTREVDSASLPRKVLRVRKANHVRFGASYISLWMCNAKARRYDSCAHQ